MVFTESEFQNRYTRARELMEKNNLDALFVTEKSNYSYFTSHRSIGWVTKTRPLFFILPVDDDPVLVLHEWEIGNARASCPWIKDIVTWVDLPFSIAPLVEVFKRLKLVKGRIGAEFGYEQRLNMPLDDLERLRKEFPAAQFVDGSSIFWKLRAKKSEAEIENIRKSSVFTSNAIEKTFSDVREGMSEKEIARLLYIHMMEEGADIPGVVALCCGPESYFQESQTPTDRKIQNGDELFIDGGCIYNEYWSDMSRAAVLGQPSNKQKRMHRLFRDATEKSIGLVQSGVKASDIVRSCLDYIRENGLSTWGVGRMGHGIGLNFTEPPSLTINDDTILEENMVITVEPGTITPYGIFCLEEVLVVTKDGSQILTTANRDLQII